MTFRIEISTKTVDFGDFMTLSYIDFSIKIDYAHKNERRIWIGVITSFRKNE